MQPNPSREFLLMLGEMTTDPIPCPGTTLGRQCENTTPGTAGDGSNLAGAISVHGSEGLFDPVRVTVPIRPIHYNARLSLLGFFHHWHRPLSPRNTLPSPPFWGSWQSLYDIGS